VDVVVPQNLSAAVNYACVTCVTYALATQLVVSLPGPLSDAGAQELAEIWADLQAFGKQIEGVPISELRDRLTEFEQRILAVVREDAVEQPGAATEDGTEDPNEGSTREDTADDDPATSTGSADDGGSTEGSTSESSTTATPTGSAVPSATDSAPSSGSAGATTSAPAGTSSPAEATPTG